MMRKWREAKKRVNLKVSKRMVELSKDRALLDKIDDEIKKHGDIKDYIEKANEYARKDKA